MQEPRLVRALDGKKGVGESKKRSSLVSVWVGSEAWGVGGGVAGNEAEVELSKAFKLKQLRCDLDITLHADVRHTFWLICKSMSIWEQVKSAQEVWQKHGKSKERDSINVLKEGLLLSTCFPLFHPLGQTQGPKIKSNKSSDHSR